MYTPPHMDIFLHYEHKPTHGILIFWLRNLFFSSAEKSQEHFGTLTTAEKNIQYNVIRLASYSHLQLA